MLEADGQNSKFVMFFCFSVDVGDSAEESRGAQAADGPIGFHV